jgi:ArsR family transcriptional regulator
MATCKQLPFDFKRQAQSLKAPTNEWLLMIVDRLNKGECSAGELTRLVGLDPSTVSRHLSVLRVAGIIDSRREGNTLMYRLLIPCVVSCFQCAGNVIKERR